MTLRPLALFKTTADLANLQRRDPGLPSLVELRKKVPIAVIDDEPFAPGGNLRSHGYNITEIGDIKSTDEVREFRIVLCDLMGVGQYFDRARQGAGWPNK